MLGAETPRPHEQQDITDVAAKIEQLLVNLAETKSEDALHALEAQLHSISRGIEAARPHRELDKDAFRYGYYDPAYQLSVCIQVAADLASRGDQAGTNIIRSALEQALRLLRRGESRKILEFEYGSPTMTVSIPTLVEVPSSWTGADEFKSTYADFVARRHQREPITTRDTAIIEKMTSLAAHAYDDVSIPRRALETAPLAREQLVLTLAKLQLLCQSLRGQVLAGDSEIVTLLLAVRGLFKYKKDAHLRNIVAQRREMGGIRKSDMLPEIDCPVVFELPPELRPSRP